MERPGLLQDLENSEDQKNHCQKQSPPLKIRSEDPV
jgi:hypothetical protein